jgi:type I restriction enzyme S subunit
MIGTLDSQVIEKFKEFQDKTRKYNDLIIEEVEFEKKLLKELHQKDKVTIQINTTADKFIEIGDIDRETKKYDISNKIKTNLPEKGKHAPKGTILISRVRPLLGGYTIIDGDDYTFTSGDLNPIVLPDNIEVNYVFKIICSPKFRIYLKNNQNTSGQKPTITNKLYDFDIPIPKDYNEKYKSIDIQKVIVEFLEYSFDNLERIKSNIDKRYGIVTKMKKSLIPSTFKRTAIKNTFKKYAKENNIEFDIIDIEFDIKILKNISQRINSGATPKKIGTNWTDINDTNGIPWLDIDRTEFEKFSIETYRKKITNIGLNSCSTWLVPKGSIMITIGGSLGFVGINNFDTCTNQNILNIVLKSDYNVQYVMYVLENFYKLNIRNKTSSYGNLSKTSEETREIFIPKDLENYTSYEVQQILANFIEHIDNEIDEKYIEKYDRAYEVVELLRETYLKRTFSKIVWS